MADDGKSLSDIEKALWKLVPLQVHIGKIIIRERFVLG